MLSAIIFAILSASGGVLASELVSRIVTPIPKLLKYSDALKACDSKGMQLAKFESRENIQYTLKLMLENNFDRAWIGSIGDDQRQQLIVEVFDGSPLLFNISQIQDKDKMLPALCIPKVVTSEVVDSGSPSVEKLVIEDKKEAVDDQKEDKIIEVEEKIADIVIEEEELKGKEEAEEEKVICTFSISDSEEGGINTRIDEAEPNEESEEIIVDENGIDEIKSKGGKNACKSFKSKSKKCHSKKKSKCRRRRSCNSSSSSSDDPSSCNSSSSSSCSSSSSSRSSCSEAPSRFCDPFEPSGSSSSSSSSDVSSKCHKKRKNRRHLSSSSSSDSSRGGCNSGLCGSRGGKFFREIRLSKRMS